MGTATCGRAVTVVVLTLTACSGASDGASETTTGATMSLATTSTTAAATTTSSGAATSTVAPEALGVPGLDDANPWCAAWAAYSGSLQVVGVAAAFGDVSSADIAVLELLAAVTIVQAIREIEADWPHELAELADEFEIVLDDLLGPYQRRADKAMSAMYDAGLTDAEAAELNKAWMQVLRSRDPAQPTVTTPDLRPELLEKVRTAAAAFDMAVTPFAADPSLVVDAIETPATDAYLAETCPDLANSGVGDAI